MIQTQLILMNLLTWCHLHQQFFVHQTVDTSAHTNYLISLVKEQMPAMRQRRTSLSSSQAAVNSRFLISGAVARGHPSKVARILRPPSAPSSLDFICFKAADFTTFRGLYGQRGAHYTRDPTVVNTSFSSIQS